MATKTLQEKQALFSMHRKLGENLHDDGDLRGALKAFRRAYRIATSAEDKDSMRQEMSELKSMLAFMSESDEGKPEWLENLLGFWSENALKIYGSLIAFAFVILVFIGFQVMQSRGQAYQTKQNMTEDNQSDKVARGDTMYDNANFGLVNKNTNGVLHIEESDTRVTMPDFDVGDSPEKYILRDQVKIYAGPQLTEQVQITLSRNTKVSVLSLSPDKKWFQVENIKKSPSFKGWVQLVDLSDSKSLSEAEKDVLIKRRMGNRYWELNPISNVRPIRYRLLINAPNAREASQALISGFETYARAPLLARHNWRNLRPFKSIQVTHGAPQLTSTFAQVGFQVQGLEPEGHIEPLGSQNLRVDKGSDGRFKAHFDL